MCTRFCDYLGSMGLCKLVKASGGYSVYVLLVLLLAYLLNQLDRYMLAIVTSQMARDIHYGDLACMRNATLDKASFVGVHCNASSQHDCESITNANGTAVCEWTYDGQGFDYQLLAGPIFIVVFTFTGIPLGFAADLYNRKVLLASCLIFWSVMTILMGFVKEYWQLALLRFGLGVGQAGCTPFAASLLGDYFTEGLRATSLGIYNWGIYVGYSMSYALGNLITRANILGQGWRWAFYLSGAPGVLLGILMFLTVKEPERRTASSSAGTTEEEVHLLETHASSSPVGKLLLLVRSFMRPSVLLLCLAGAIRNAAGYVWAYNTQVYYEDLGQTAEQIATFMSWVPLVAGSVSVVVGGFVADRVNVWAGPQARVAVIVISLVLAAPFTAGALWLPFPWAYISLIPAYIIGEVWVGITLAIIIELVPKELRTASIALYLFIISNIGGNIPLLVPPLQNFFQKSLHLNKISALRAALTVLYPGEYVLGALLYLVSLLSLRRDIAKAKTVAGQRLLVDDDDDLIT